MFTFAQNIFNGQQISAETGIGFYIKAGIFLLEQNIGFSADVFHHVLWDLSYRTFYV